MNVDQEPPEAAGARLGAQLAAHGLEAVEYSPDLMGLHLLSDRAAYLDRLERHLRVMAACGSRILRLDSGLAPEAARAEEVMQAAAARLGEAARLADDYGARVVWEFEPGFLFNKPAEIVAFAALLEPHGVSVLLDSCHAQLCAVEGARQTGERERLPGGIPALIEALGGRIGLVHLIDSDGGLHDADTSNHVPLGDGVIDFSQVLPALAASYRGDWVVLDLCFHPDAWAVSARCKAWLDETIPSLWPERPAEE